MGLLLHHVRSQAVEVLRLDSSYALDDKQPLSQLGLDSLMAMELKNRIEYELGVVLPFVKLLEGPSTLQLTHNVLEQLPATPDQDWDVLEL